MKCGLCLYSADQYCCTFGTLFLINRILDVVAVRCAVGVIMGNTKFVSPAPPNYDDLQSDRDNYAPIF